VPLPNNPPPIRLKRKRPHPHRKGKKGPFPSLNKGGKKKRILPQKKKSTHFQKKLRKNTPATQSLPLKNEREKKLEKGRGIAITKKRGGSHGAPLDAHSYFYPVRNRSGEPTGKERHLLVGKKKKNFPTRPLYKKKREVKKIEIKGGGGGGLCGAVGPKKGRAKGGRKKMSS